MWRHEDIWRTLGGGIDFLTGEPLADEWEQSRKGLEPAGLVRLTAAPLIHGAAQVAMLAALFAGDTVVLPPQFDAREVWRAVERHKVNLIFIIGDAMAQAADRGVPRGRLRRLLAAGHLLQRGAVLPGGQGRLRRGAAERSSSPTRSAPPRPGSPASAW